MIHLEGTTYECSISVQVEANGPLEAAALASVQFRDPDVDWWDIEVFDVDKGREYSEVIDERDALNAEAEESS